MLKQTFGYTIFKFKEGMDEPEQWTDREYFTVTAPTRHELEKESEAELRRIDSEWGDDYYVDDVVWSDVKECDDEYDDDDEDYDEEYDDEEYDDLW